MKRLNALPAWNARDVEAVLAHFHNDVLFVSPVPQTIGFASDGTVRGRHALRRYWHEALAIIRRCTSP
ncbi:MAG: hypothetical protein JWM36_246 [Hyphomicrobiales bacterium]|nr:hypothetical protein [Hyphomicrobiales bacterium]